MTTIPCQWCGNEAAWQCTATTPGGAVTVIAYCTADACWRKTYDTVKAHPQRAWKQATPPSYGRGHTGQQPLF